VRDRVLWIICACYAVLYALLGLVRYAAHRNLVDFGIFAQTARSAFACFCNPIEGSHWAFHFSPILFVPAALLALWKSPLVLIGLSALLGALTIPPVYGLVARRSDRRTARLTAAVVAVYPPLAGLVFGDFHENVFAPATVAWMLWAFDGGRLRLALLFALLTMAVKEDQAIFIGIAGVLGAWRFRGTSPGRYAALIGGIGFVVALTFFYRIAPHANANPLWQPQRFYAWSAGDVRALLPRGVLERLGFGLLAFGPLLFLPFRSRMMWLAAAPLAEVVLSRMSTTYTAGTHYAGAWLGYVLVAFAFAVRNLEPRKAGRALAWCVGLCIVVMLVANPLHPGLNLRAPQARDGALDRFLSTLPANADVATQEEAYTHLALVDPHATLLPERANVPLTSCYALVDADFPDSPRLVEYGAALDALVRARRYLSVRREGSIQLYRRTDCAPPGAATP
jgi:uncharacterized membrane protein